MKRSAIILMLLSVSIFANAQNYKNDGKSYYFYCQINSGTRDIIWPQEKVYQPLYDEQGKKEKIESGAALLTYMSKRGWECVNLSHIETLVPNSDVNFIFRKEVKTDEEAKEGLFFKSDFKEQKKESQD